MVVSSLFRMYIFIFIVVGNDVVVAVIIPAPFVYFIVMGSIILCTTAIAIACTTCT